jgi:hypothetical protein
MQAEIRKCRDRDGSDVSRLAILSVGTVKIHKGMKWAHKGVICVLYYEGPDAVFKFIENLHLHIENQE